MPLMVQGHPIQKRYEMEQIIAAFLELAVRYWFIALPIAITVIFIIVFGKKGSRY